MFDPLSHFEKDKHVVQISIKWLKKIILALNFSKMGID